MADRNFSLDATIALLERTPASLTALLSGLPESFTTATEGGDTWSPYDVIGHLIQGERSDWMSRVRHIMSGNAAPFPPFDRTAQFARASENLAERLTTFAALRAESLKALRSMALTDADLDRPGLHPALGAVTLRQLLATWTVHDLDHLTQISRVMAKHYRDEVGPWSAYLNVLRDREPAVS